MSHDARKLSLIGIAFHGLSPTCLYTLGGDPRSALPSQATQFSATLSEIAQSKAPSCPQRSLQLLDCHDISLADGTLHEVTAGFLQTQLEACKCTAAALGLPDFVSKPRAVAR